MTLDSRENVSTVRLATLQASRLKLTWNIPRAVVPQATTPEAVMRELILLAIIFVKTDPIEWPILKAKFLAIY